METNMVSISSEICAKIKKKRKIRINNNSKYSIFVNQNTALCLYISIILSINLYSNISII